MHEEHDDADVVERAVGIPEAGQAPLGWKPGSQLAVTGDRDVVSLKPITTPVRVEFAALAAKARG